MSNYIGIIEKQNKRLLSENKELKDKLKQFKKIASYLEKKEQSLIDKELAKIQKIVCKYYQVNELAFFSRSKKEENAIPRQIFCYLARELTVYSYPVIAKFINRTHATVLHGYNTILGYIEFNQKLEFIQYIPELMDVLKIVFGKKLKAIQKTNYFKSFNLN